MWKAQRTICSSPAMISSLTKTCAALFLKCLTLPWGRRRFACGPARSPQSTARAGAGSRRIAVRPAQLAFLTGEERDAYLAAEPADDARFLAVFAHSLEHTGGYPPLEAKRVASTLLPDLLPYNSSRPASPDNGRTLTEDVFDSFVTILTNGKVTQDGVGPHNDLVAEFPYLGPPHGPRDESVGRR